MLILQFVLQEVMPWPCQKNFAQMTASEMHTDYPILCERCFLKHKSLENFTR